MSELTRRDELRAALRQVTLARVALPVAGHSIAIKEELAFRLAAARARDAVKQALDGAGFAERLRAELGVEAAALQSQAPDRATYLRRPDLGRRLSPASALRLAAGLFDLAIAVVDGLSALAVERNAMPLLARLLPMLVDANWVCAPLTVVEQGRVAIGDEIGARLGARASLVLIGERPGLSAPDSLGAYLTWQPGPGRTDNDRNCVSNIRAGGLTAEEAAARIFWYLRAARAGGLSGTMLKDGSAGLTEG